MMKQEFEKLINESRPTPPKGATPLTVTDGEWSIIELVYMYHPSIEKKEDIVMIFLRFGMMVIEDMATRSEDMCHLENQIQVAESNLQRLREEKRNKSKR